MWIVPEKSPPHPSSFWTEMASNAHFTLYMKSKSSFFEVVRSFFPVSDVINAAGNLLSGGKVDVSSIDNSKPVIESTMSSPSSPLQTYTSFKVDYENSVMSSDSLSFLPGPEKAQTLSKSLMDYKYHIVLKCSSRQEDFIVSSSDSLKDIHDNWNWIERQLFPKIAEISIDYFENECTPTTEENSQEITEAEKSKSVQIAIDDFVLSQFDVSSMDDGTLNANDSKTIPKKRSEILEKMKSVFKMESLETLLYYYSCAVVSGETSTLIRGTLFLTQNFACFYSLGSGSKKLYFQIHFKDILKIDLINEKKLLLGECMVIESRHQKQIYDTMIYLCDQAMKTLVKGTEESKLIRRSESSDWDKFKSTRDERNRSQSISSIDLSKVGDIGGGSFLMRKTFSRESFSNNNNINNNNSPSSFGPDISEVKKQTDFSRQFRLSLEEKAIEVHSCSLYFEAMKRIVSGALYITVNYVCFRGQGDLFYVVIPFRTVISIKKHNVLGFLTTKYIVISTASRLDYQFFAFHSRGGIFDLITKCWKTCPQTMPGPIDDPIRSVVITGVGVEVKEEEGNYNPTSSNTNTISNLADNFQKSSSVGLGFIYPLPKNNELERKKEKLWLEYFKSHGGRSVSLIICEDIRKLIVNGIPDLFRPYLWLIFTGCAYEEAYVMSSSKGNINSKFLQIYEDNKEKQEFQPILEEIEKDVKRSLPEHPAFQKSEGIDSLRRLLSAFAFHNRNIGYAQSMNIIASLLLLFLPEEQAFLILKALCERILPDHYSKSLVGSVLDQRVFEELLKIYFPHVWNHVKTQLVSMELSFLTFPWFVCLFANSFPIGMACRVLDVFFLEGPVYLQWLALAIIQANEGEIVKCRDEEQVMLVFKRFFEGFYVREEEGKGKEQAIIVLEKTITDLLSLAYDYSFISVRKLDELRSKLRVEVVQKLEISNKKMTISNLSELSKFSRKEIDAVYEAFRRLNFTSSDNALSLDVFQKLCQSVLPWGKRLGPRLLQRFFDYCCTLGLEKRKVILEDVIELFDLLCHAKINDKLVFLFKIHDDDNDEILSESEFSELIESLASITSCSGDESNQILLLNELKDLAFKMKNYNGSPSSTTAPQSSSINSKRFVLEFLLKQSLTEYFEGPFSLVLYS